MGPHKKLTYREVHVTRGRKQNMKPVVFQRNKLHHDQGVKAVSPEPGMQQHYDEEVKDLTLEPGVVQSVPINTGISTG